MLVEKQHPIAEHDPILKSLVDLSQTRIDNEKQNMYCDLNKSCRDDTGHVNCMHYAVEWAYEAGWQRQALLNAYESHNRTGRTEKPSKNPVRYHTKLVKTHKKRRWANLNHQNKQIHK